MKKQTDQENAILEHTTMDCVYAPPEFVGKNPSLDSSAAYPSIYSVDGKSNRMEDDFQYDGMNTVYDSPEMLCGNAGKMEGRRQYQDTEETVQFCENCRQPILIDELFCPYCGNHTKAGRKETPPMACVYASPEIMGTIRPTRQEQAQPKKPKEHKGFLSRIFPRKR